MAVQLASWTPIEVATPRKPEVLRMAATLGLDRHTIVGWLVEIWGWAGEQSVDGYVDASVDAIEIMLSAPKGFLRAMIAVGWLSEHENGVKFPNADKWLSGASKSRLKKNIRQQSWRENRGQNVDDPVDVSRASEPSTREDKIRDIYKGEENSDDSESHKDERPQPASQLIPPPIEDVIAFGVRLALPETECRNFFDHYEMCKWKRSGNTRISDWQAALRKWHRNWRAGVFTNGRAPPGGPVIGKVVPKEDWKKKPYCAG